MADLRVQFYRWAIPDALREVAEDYPFVRRIAAGQGTPANPARFHLDYVRGKPQSEQEVLATALVKRSNSKGAVAAGDEATQPERLAVERYETACKVAGIGRAMPGSRMERGVEKSFRALAERSLSVHLGAPAVDANMLRFSTQVGRFRVVTFVDWGTQGCALRYSHSVFGEEARLPLFGNISCLMWLGIRGQTDWTVVQASAVEDVVGALDGLAEHFMRAVRQKVLV